MQTHSPSVQSSQPLQLAGQLAQSQSLCDETSVDGGMDAVQPPAEQHDDFSPSDVSEVNEVEPLQPQLSQTQSAQVHVSPAQHPQPSSHWPHGHDNELLLIAGEAVNVAAAKKGIAT